MMYVNQKFATNEIQGKAIMLEIKLPREIDKSPLAMEMVLSNMTQGSGTGTWYSRGISGALPTTFSLEIASLEGVVHFYIRTHKKYKELLSSALYAHYPGVEVIEADDYTSLFPRYEHNKPNQASVWGNSFKLAREFTVSKKDTDKKQSFLEKYVFFDDIEKEAKEEKLPADVVPIRTYVDLGLDKQKEEMKVDPLVSILEYFGSLGKGEFAGLQIIIEDEGVHDVKKSGTIYHHPVTHESLRVSKLAQIYKDSLRGKKEFKEGDKIIDKYGNAEMKMEGEGENKKSVPKTYGDDITEIGSEQSLTYETKNLIELVERKLSKPLLFCAMRTIYVTKPEAFRVPNIMNCLAMMKPFSAPGFNTFGLAAFSDPYDYDWENPGKVKSNWRGEEVFEAYVEREGFHPHTGLIKWLGSETKGADADRYFYNHSMGVRKFITMVVEAILEPFGHPHADGVFVMNTEELATIFHLPGLVANVPTLPRIDSRKAVAPVNLPV